MGIGNKIGLAAMLAVVGAAHAADGDPDPTFSGDGRASTTWPHSISGVRLAVGQDGSLFHAATEAIDTVDGANLDFAIAKFRPDGALDPTFGFLGRRTVGFDLVPDGDDSLLAPFVLPDGSLLLAGTVDLDPESFTYAAPALVKLTSGGNVDPAFGDDGRVVMATTPYVEGNSYLDWHAVVRQPDGKLVFAGDCFDCDGEQRAVAMRLTATGALDTTFGNGGWFDVIADSSVSINAVALDAQGRIVLGGVREPDDSAYDRPWFVRLMPNGALDTGFGEAGIAWFPEVPTFNNDWSGRAMAIQRDGSILLALGNGAGALVRVTAQGILDAGFGEAGFLSLEREEGTDIRAVAVGSDARIVFAGTIHHTGGGFDHYVGRLLPDGSFDDTFDGNGVLRIDMTPGEDDGARATALVDGRPVIAGYGGVDYRVATLLRLQSDLIFTDGFAH
jgi:uncharacterized delta-60 repeat protein